MSSFQKVARLPSVQMPSRLSQHHATKFFNDVISEMAFTSTLSYGLRDEVLLAPVASKLTDRTCREISKIIPLVKPTVSNFIVNLVPKEALPDHLFWELKFLKCDDVRIFNTRVNNELEELEQIIAGRGYLHGKAWTLSTECPDMQAISSRFCARQETFNRPLWNNLLYYLTSLGMT